MPPTKSNQPGGPHGPLERRPLEDRDVRLARLRRRRLRARRRGRHEDDRPEHAGPGESGRMDRILDAGFKQPADESVLIQSTSLTDERSRLHGRDRGRRRAASPRLDVVQNVRSPLAPGNSGQIAKDGHSALVEFEIRGDADEAVDKIGPVLDRVDEAQKAHPELFIGEFGDASAVDGDQTRLRRRSREGRALLAPDHADHPRARVRSARGGGHPAAARAHRRVRDVRAGRAARATCCRWPRRPPRWCS